MLFDTSLVFGSGHFCDWHYPDRPIATDNLQQVKPEPTGQHYRQTVNRWTSPIGQLPIISGELPHLASYALRACVCSYVGLPISTGSALDTDDFRLPTFGLTFPPLAEALVPNAKIRIPSSRMLIAAFTSRSCFVPQF